MSDATQDRKPAQLILEYQEVLKTRLLPTLKAAKEQQAKRQAQLDVFKALEADLHKLQKGVKELTILKDIGCGVHMQAKVPDTSHIFVDVGLGFYAEATLDEASQIAADRSAALQQLVTDATYKVAEIEADVKRLQKSISSLHQHV